MSSCYSYFGENMSEPAPKHDLHIFWLAVPYTLLGIGELLVVVSLWDLSFDLVPNSLKAVSHSVIMSSKAIGVWLSIYIGQVPERLVAGNLDRGHVEHVFMIHGLLCLISVLIRVIISLT